MWMTSFEDAKNEALKLRKPILLQFEMAGCGGCQKLFEETYRHAKVTQELQEWFVKLKLDLLKEREVRRELGAYWTPSFYFLDHNGKSYYKFNGYLPPTEFRILLRLGYAEVMIPKGKYTEAVQIMSVDLYELDSPLLPTLLVQKGIAEYIHSKDRSAFMRLMKEVKEKYPNNLAAKMYFWKV